MWQVMFDCVMKSRFPFIILRAYVYTVLQQEIDYTSVFFCNRILERCCSEVVLLV
jgi:hypothetical protein